MATDALAQRHLAGAMDDRQAVDAESRRDLVGDLGHDRQGHLGQRLVLERLDAPAGVAAASSSWPGAGVPGDRRVTPRKPTTAPSSSVASRPDSSASTSGPSGPSRTSRIRRAGSLLSGASAPPLTGGIIATSSPSASSVSAGA